MLFYLAKRLVYMVITILLVSVLAFVIIQLPPGDYVTTRIMQLRMEGQDLSESEIANLRDRYGLDRPVYVQYLRWIWNIVRYGDFGVSYEWNQPVRNLIGERLLLTTVISFATMIFTFGVAIPIGIYSALRQYSVPDFAFTAIGYIGLSTPNFLLALVLLFIAHVAGGSVGGLFSPEYVNAPWSIGRVVDLLRHLWIPMVVLGTAGTAGLIRVTRGMMLDELKKQYVVTARAKGVSERRLVFKYPVRVALIPIVSTIGWQLANIVSGAPIVAVVLSLPTTGPLLLSALLSQDMYLAGTFILFLSILTVIGTFVSDVLLAAMDPRIRLEM